MRDKRRNPGVTTHQVHKRVVEQIVKSSLFDRLPQDKQTELLSELVSPSNRIPYVSLEWRYVWSLGVNLYTSFPYRATEKDEEDTVHVYDLRVEVSWSSTARSPACARAAINIYSQVTDLACLLEAIGAENKICELATRSDT